LKVGLWRGLGARQPPLVCVYSEERSHSRCWRLLLLPLQLLISFHPKAQSANQMRQGRPVIKRRSGKWISFFEFVFASLLQRIRTRLVIVWRGIRRGDGSEARACGAGVHVEVAGNTTPSTRRQLLLGFSTGWSALQRVLQVSRVDYPRRPPAPRRPRVRSRCSER